MSWLARSLVNSLRSDSGDDDDDDEGEAKPPPTGPHGDEPIGGEEMGDDGGGEGGAPTRGVKEDLSELTQTLTRQFWGVASFLAPPPLPSSQSPSPRSPSSGSSLPDSGRRRDSPSADEAESPRIAGIRSDFAEISGRVRSGISMLSSAKAVSEISKIASTFLPFGSEEGEEEKEEEEEGEEEEDGGEEMVELARAVGITEEVLTFARNIAMHPETWLDFPLVHDDEDSDDFEMSDAQQEHASAIERLAPRLAALRIEFCPSHMSEGCFWKIYFVLLHSRLNRHDAELLSTPQIVEARAMLLQDLQNRSKPNSERSARETSFGKEDATSVCIDENATSPSNTLPETSLPKTSSPPGDPISVPVADFETEKHPVQTTEVKIIDKSVIEEEPPSQAKNKDLTMETTKVSIQRDDEDADDWLEEETGEMGNIGRTAIPLGHEEDVSFSDLEDDDDDQGAFPSSKGGAHASDSQTKDPKDWVQLNKGSGGSTMSSNSTSPMTKESNDWLNVEDIDVE